MADNVTLSAGTADGAVVATDQDASAPNGHYQLNKLVFGALNTFTLVTSSAGLPVAQQGTWTVDLGATDNAVLDAIAASVAGTLTVGSHAVTNAGTFAVQVDGNALTSLQLIDDVIATLGTTTYTEAATKGAIMGAVRRDADTTLVDTTNEIGPLQMNALGQLKVEAFSGETLPVSLASVPSHAVTNAGTFAVQVDGSALTSLQLLDDVVFTDDAAFTPATSKGFAVGFQADETAADSVDEGDFGVPRMTLDRMVRVAAEQADSVRVGATSRAVSRAAVAGNTSGDNTLVTNSNGGLSVRVFALTLVATAAVSLYFTSDAAGSVIFGGSTHKIALAANSGFVLPFNPAGWFQTAANHDVIMNLSGAVAVSGGIVYAEV